MILILVGDVGQPGRVVDTVVEELWTANEAFVVSTVSDLSFSYGNGGGVHVHQAQAGMLRPDVVFHWLTGRQARSTLDVLHLAGYRLLNPVAAWRIGRNKAMQLAAFEQHCIPHPWSFFTYAGWDAVARNVRWRDGEYVLKPHNASRGQDVKRAPDARTAQELFRATPRFATGVLVQEFIDHCPKPRHHFRVNVVGGVPVRCNEFFAAPGTWISNHARGGYRADDADPNDVSNAPPEVLALAVRATQAVGADYSGVDVIEGPGGKFFVLEANELPDFGAATARHLAHHIIALAHDKRLS